MRAGDTLPGYTRLAVFEVLKCFTLQGSSVIFDHFHCTSGMMHLREISAHIIVLLAFN